MTFHGPDLTATTGSILCHAAINPTGSFISDLHNCNSIRSTKQTPTKVGGPAFFHSSYFFEFISFDFVLDSTALTQSHVASVPLELEDPSGAGWLLPAACLPAASALLTRRCHFSTSRVFSSTQFVSKLMNRIKRNADADGNREKREDEVNCYTNKGRRQSSFFHTIAILDTRFINEGKGQIFSRAIILYQRSEFR